MYVNYNELMPEGVKLYLQIEKFINEHISLERSLIHLIKLKASQLNGCAYCINLHVHEALEDGETQERLHLLHVYHETDNLFTERERMALLITERVTLISEFGMDSDFLKKVATQFTQKEYVEVLFVLNQINAWNRLSISTLRPYQ